jgi:nicotinamidase-related amidase
MIGTFSPTDSALLLIDHQLGTMKLIKNIPLDVVKRNTLALAKTAKLLGIPVILTSSQEQNQQGPLMPELEQILPEAFAARVKRAGIVNAWNDPHFKQAVESTGRRNLIMAGVTTDVCLVFPTISACREGYQVQAVMDASGSPYEISEEMSRRRMEREGVVLTATNTLMAELAQDWSRPEGSQLLSILFQEVLPPIAESGSQGGRPPQPPHHRAGGSALGGSGRIVKCDPQGTNRDQPQRLREPLVSHTGLGGERPRQMPRAFATQRREGRCFLGGPQFQ